MKVHVILAVLPYLLAVSVSGQSPKQTAVTQPACGPDEVKYDTRKVKQHPVVDPGDQSAVIYVVSQLDFGGYKTGCQVVTRIGVDGRWLGANCGTSYLSANVLVGEHHVCADWQSIVFLSSRPHPALRSFTAEAGKTYYFRAKALYISGLVTLDLDPLDADEGRALVESSSASVSKPKK